MDKTLGVYRFVFCIAYLDDLIIYSPDLDTHIQHIKLVLEKLRKSRKAKPIIEYPVPVSLKGLEQFLGMAGVYQRFIGQYQLKAEPLRKLKKKDAEFKWAAEQQEAFEIIKRDLFLLPTLKQPNFAMTFEIHSDAATKAGIAVILCQRYNDTPYSLVFASRSLTSTEKSYSVQEVECLAVVFGIKKFRQFLECGIFLVYTDHSSLQWVLNTKEDKQARIWRWSVDTYNWVNTQSQDRDLQEIKQKIADHPTFIIKDNILYKILVDKYNLKKNNVYIVVPSTVIPSILNQFHDSKFAGHFSAKKTKSRILHYLLWWRNMEEDVKKYCQQCSQCQATKGSKSKQYEFRTTHGSYPFQRVAIDFWGPLPTAQGVKAYKYILVVLDTYTKFVELFPVVSTSSEEVAEVFYNKFILKHGVPEEVLQDNDPPFSSPYHSQLTKLIGSENMFTPAYYPQSNGMS
ncbi:hypothetical protein G6F26_011923 [Rhizopus arrhizus]|nr:hypothetical protein G6F30_004990 [Rhizopus arrhizus]KAG1017200.1 hypothetical protein G6F26_011923 [Rhizopus arrhizus]KAG1037212.1 hypothetical protein G6F25_007378 [Rhizopus arrhizus]KAG1272422.1 hypothetical protein G6F65_011712 [Rhizopus arrhizus]KAG1412022.1 hypothetical protein G6F59_011342 [Rhizopus arrhizus]